MCICRRPSYRPSHLIRRLFIAYTRLFEALTEELVELEEDEGSEVRMQPFSERPRAADGARGELGNRSSC